jgi:hypothetical protein
MSVGIRVRARATGVARPHLGLSRRLAVCQEKLLHSFPPHRSQAGRVDHRATVGSVGHLGLKCSELLDGEWRGESRCVSLATMCVLLTHLPNTPASWAHLSRRSRLVGVCHERGSTWRGGNLLKSRSVAVGGSQPGIHRAHQGLQLLPKGGGIAQGREVGIRLWPAGV